METITCTPDDLAAAFTEWERRYREEPERFMAEARRLLAETPESYGEACAPYFLTLLKEAGEASADPRRRALASGWWPPPPDSDRFWLHPEHGPVHEDDLAGVLRREAGVTGAAVGEGQSLPGPVRRVGDDPRARDEYLARRLEGHLARPRRRGSFPEEEN